MAETSIVSDRAERAELSAKKATAHSFTPASVTKIRLLTLLGALAIWEGLAALGRAGILYGDVIPSSWKIGEAVFYELTSSGFYHDLGVTAIEHSAGFVIGALVALAVGIAMGSNALLRKALEPYLNAIGSTPKIIFLPILFLIFGTGIESKIAKGALSAFFPVVFATVLGMLLIPKVLIAVGKSFNMTNWQMIRKIYLPAMMNPVITGFRLGIAITVIGVLVAELKFADAGLGYRIGIYYEQFRIASMYAIILIIFAIAAGLNVIMTLVQDRMNRHVAPTSRKRGKVGTSSSLG